MTKVAKNYEKLNKYLEDKNFDEKEALLSHYMQLKDTKFAENYKARLVKEGIDVSKISDDEIKSAAKNVPLLYPAFAAVSTKNAVPYIKFILKIYIDLSLFHTYTICMKPITINVSEAVYTRYQDEAARHGSKAAELIRDAMNFYLNEKLSKQHSLDSWQPLHLGSVLSDWADNANREEMLNDRY